MFLVCKVQCFDLGLVLDQICNTVVTTHAFAIFLFRVISIFNGGFVNRLAPLMSQMTNIRFLVLPPSLSLLLTGSVTEKGAVIRYIQNLQ
jgi:heme/copper-type cytochrome/quinol oxidase subunit 1